MLRKRLAALTMAGCLLTGIGCSSTSSSTGGGLFGYGSGGSGGSCCGKGRLFGGSSSSAPAMTASAGPDCTCASGGGEIGGIYHPVGLSSQGPGGAPIMMGHDMGGMGGSMPPQNMPVQTMPIQNMPVQNLPAYPNIPSQPAPGGQPPRIQPVPMTPSGVAPSSGMAAPAPWGPQ